jgi:hypothetical protein
MCDPLLTTLRGHNKIGRHQSGVTPLDQYRYILYPINPDNHGQHKSINILDVPYLTYAFRTGYIINIVNESNS